MLRRIQETVTLDKEMLLSESLSTDKGQFSLPVLINVLLYALATKRGFQEPDPSGKARVLRDLIHKRGKPPPVYR